MVLDVLERSKDSWIYNENHRAAFDKFRIRNREKRIYLLKTSRFPVVIFKTLHDIHKMDLVMEGHPDCRGIWIYRHYRDVVNSSLRRWKNFAADLMINAVKNDRWEDNLLAGISEEEKGIVEKCVERALSAPSAWALFWILRNRLFLRCGADMAEKRILPIKYEEMVNEPEGQFRRTFDFIGLPFDNSYVSRVYAESVHKEPPPLIDDRVRELCDETMNHLDEVWNIACRNFSKLAPID